MIEREGAIGLAAEDVDDLLAGAAHAPGPHGARPWLFRVRPDVIEIHADPDQRLPFADPFGRLRRLACGAALFNLQLGLLGRGVRPIVSVLPDPARPDLVAEVRHGGRKWATPEQLRLLDAAPLQRTARHPCTSDPLTGADRNALSRAALAEGAWLQVVTDPRQRRELRRMALDGEPDATAAQDHADDSALAVLTAHGTGPSADVHAGRAVQRTLLTATACGLVASLLTPALETDRTRQELRRMLRAAVPPHAVLGLGRAAPPRETARGTR